MFKVDIPPGGGRGPVEEALLLKQRTKSENLPPPAVQLVRDGIIGGESDDERLPGMTGQLDVRQEHGRPGALSEITQSAGHGLGIVEDVVTVDIGRGALEPLGSAPFEQLLLVD